MFLFYISHTMAFVFSLSTHKLNESLEHGHASMQEDLGSIPATSSLLSPLRHNVQQKMAPEVIIWIQQKKLIRYATPSSC